MKTVRLRVSAKLAANTPQPDVVTIRDPLEHRTGAVDVGRQRGERRERELRLRQVEPLTLSANPRASADRLRGRSEVSS